MTIIVVVCAHNEERYIAACLHSLLAQSRPPDEIIPINNASNDGTARVAAAVPGVRVVHELRKGLVIARERGRQVGGILALPIVPVLMAAPFVHFLHEDRFNRDLLYDLVSRPEHAARLVPGLAA